MKIRSLLLVVLIISAGAFRPALAQSTTAFTYQGRLNSASGPASGFYDMTFAVWDTNVAGDLIAGPITNIGVPVTNGLFIATLDFGPGVFTGSNYWVEMAVRTNGLGSFSTLVPRQQLTPAPYAISLVAPQSTALCPPGSVMAYMGTNAPAGWLICDGSAVSRTEYPALFAVIGVASGAGDFITTFNLPDMRGVFLRGLNGPRNDGLADPDSSSAFRTNIFTGGNQGNAVGSYQADVFQAHSHSVNVPDSDGYGYTAGLYPAYAAFGEQIYTFQTSTEGGDETRPKNVYVNYIIKY